MQLLPQGDGCGAVALTTAALTEHDCQGSGAGRRFPVGVPYERWSGCRPRPPNIKGKFLLIFLCLFHSSGK